MIPIPVKRCHPVSVMIKILKEFSKFGLYSNLIDMKMPIIPEPIKT
jgi:hypothetical protein